MNDLNILTPSRSRATGLLNLFNSIVKTASGKFRIGFIIGTDNDDPKRDEYQAAFESMLQQDIDFIDIEWVVNDRMPINKLVNELWHINDARYYVTGNDDFVFDSPGWDQVLFDEINLRPHPYFMYFFDDGIQHGNHGAFPIISREWCNEQGYYFPDIFKHNYPDTWINDIAVRLGTRVYIDRIKTRHLHHSTGQSELDQVYIDGMQDGANEHDKQLYMSMTAERINIANTLKQRINDRTLQSGRNQRF